MKETILNSDGSKSSYLRPKRVLKVHLCELLQLARDDIGFKFGLTTLMGLRPAWVLLSREARCLTCLCDRCANVQNCLVSLTKFVQRKRQHGTPSDRSALSGFDLSSSTSEFLTLVLHPKALATSGRQIWAEQMGVIISAYHETGLRNQGGEGIRAAR